MTISDAHIHFFSRRFFSLLAGDAAETCRKLNWECPPEEPEALAAQWVEAMDRAGVRRAALIASLPGDEASVLAARAAYPERFAAYAMLNPLSGAVPHPGLDAVCLFPAMQGFSIGGSDAGRVIDHARLIFVHCGVLSVGVRKKLGLTSRFDMRYSNPLDLHPVALRYPEKRFVIPHFGAGMFREALMAADLCPNIYLDTSSSNSWMKYEGLDLSEVFQRAIAVVGVDRLLFGTDSSFFPRGWNRAVYEEQKAALEKIGVSSVDQQKIFGENFDALLPANPSSVAVKS